MRDILYDAAVTYDKFKNTFYNIILGRKGKSYTIKLHFPADAFFHLSGLQHLKDLTFPSTNKERIYKEILKRKITIDDIKKSVFYEKWFIEERLNNFTYLEDLLDSNTVRYLINQKQYMRYSDIKADYLCERAILTDIFYLFIVKEMNLRDSNICKGCSLLKKHNTDYTNGTAKTTTLLIEKINNGSTSVIYKNPSFKQI